MAAPGQDPLARGWTRGGEIHLWVTKDGRSEREIGSREIGQIADTEREMESEASRRADHPPPPLKDPTDSHRIRNSMR